MESAYILLLLAGGIVYVAGAGAVWFALGRMNPRHRKARPGGTRPAVSVVIAARNEAFSIGHLIADLALQTWPRELTDIIVADDRSTDGTGEMVRAAAASSGIDVRVIRVDSVQAGISPKKHALSSAIQAAGGEIILQTDADCRVAPGWIAAMADAFGDGVAMVVAPAPYREEPGILNAFVRHEYLWNAALMLGSTILGMGTHASGRNLAFRRDVFLAIGGYGDSAAVRSGDDTLLLHRIRRRRAGRIEAVCDPAARTVTGAPQTIGAFLRQRIRHFSTGRLFDPGLIAAGVPVYGFHTLLVAGPFAAFAAPAAGWAALGAFTAKLVVDALVAARLSRLTGLGVQWRAFPAIEAAAAVYFALLPLMGLVFPVRWEKNR